VKQIKIGSRSWEDACRSCELQALKALRHQFIVKLRELIRGQRDGSLYYIFDFLDSDLCRLLKYNSNGLEEIRAAALMRQLFAGLAHMHQHNFFHRDIKPENILLDVTTETIRIADFGQARSLRARPPFTDYVGTRWYRAPECLLRDRSYSSPVDIWACGLIFAELLRGSPVFCGNSSIDQLYKIFTVLGPPPTDWPEFAKLAQALRFRVPDRSCGLLRVVPQCTPKCIGFLSETLALNPRRRPLSKKCLEHPYFHVLPALDLDRLDASAPLQISHSARGESEQPDYRSTQPVVEDVSEDRLDVSDDRKLSKECLVPVCDVLAYDLDLDAELDAILGDDVDCLESRPPSSTCGFESVATEPRRQSELQEKSATHGGGFDFFAPARSKAAEGYSIEASTSAAPDDHLDRLLESLDIEDTKQADVNTSIKSPEEAEVDRLRAEKKAELDRLEAEAAEAVAKAEAQRLAEEALVKAEAERVHAEKAARLATERLAAEAVAKAEADRIAESERQVAEAAERAEIQRFAAEQAAEAEVERIAEEKAAMAEAELKAEAERRAEEVAKAELERIATETATRKETECKAEVERLAAEAVANAEAERASNAESEATVVEDSTKAEVESEGDAESLAVKCLKEDTACTAVDIEAKREPDEIPVEACETIEVENVASTIEVENVASLRSVAERRIMAECHDFVSDGIAKGGDFRLRAETVARSQLRRSLAEVSADAHVSECDDECEDMRLDPQQSSQIKREDVELERLREENATLRELLGSKASGKPSDLRNTCSARADVDDLDTSRRNPLKDKPWTADEAKRLRKVVKHIIRNGTRDKVLLWTEVCTELGNGRSAKECKMQYKRDYLAHKAKATEMQAGELVKVS